jgi:hypothetical protein
MNILEYNVGELNRIEKENIEGGFIMEVLAIGAAIYSCGMAYGYYSK